MAKNWEIKFSQAAMREAKQMFSSLAKTVAREDNPQFSSIVDQLNDSFKKAAMVVRDKAKSYASSGGSATRLFSGSQPAIFAFLDLNATNNPKRKGSPLVGVRTGKYQSDRRLWKTWGFGSKRRKGGTVAHGGVSMSLGAMFERGTRRDGRRIIKPLRFFQSARFSTRMEVAEILKNAYLRASAAIQRFK